MIIASLEQLTGQVADTSKMRAALDWLRAAVAAPIADGKIAIDGERIRAIVQSYDSRRRAESVKFEAHRAYIDIQCVVAGRELVGWAPLSALAVTQAYDNTKDVLFGTVGADAASFVRLGTGQAMVLFPEDAHAPSLADGEPTAVKKIVVKVAVAD
jgi:biofilm protein TabA